jgi:hypothetical protein
MIILQKKSSEKIKYCIEYRWIDYPMAASEKFLYAEVGYELTKEEADALVEKLNHEDDLRVKRLKDEGYHYVEYCNYFATKVE